MPTPDCGRLPLLAWTEATKGTDGATGSATAGIATGGGELREREEELLATEEEMIPNGSMTDDEDAAITLEDDQTGIASALEDDHIGIAASEDEDDIVPGQTGHEKDESEDEVACAK